MAKEAAVAQLKSDLRRFHPVAPVRRMVRRISEYELYIGCRFCAMIVPAEREEGNVIPPVRACPSRPLVLVASSLHLCAPDTCTKAPRFPPGWYPHEQRTMANKLRRRDTTRPQEFSRDVDATVQI